MEKIKTKCVSKLDDCIIKHNALMAEYEVKY